MTISMLALLRRLLVVIVSITVVLLTGGGGRAAGQDSPVAPPDTQVLDRTNTFAFAAENPCSSDTRQMTIDHRSVFTPGEASNDSSAPHYWSTLDQSGEFDLEPPRPGGTIYHGKFHIQAGHPDGHYTDYVLPIQLLGTGSDGTTFRTHLFEHIKVTDQGFEITFTTGSFGMDQLTCS